MTASEINAKASEGLKAVNAHYEFVVNHAKAYGVSSEVIINYEAKESETEQENKPKVNIHKMNKELANNGMQNYSKLLYFYFNISANHDIVSLVVGLE